MTRCGIIILAAGESSRLGNPKQLLAYKGNTLLDHQILQAQQTQAAIVVVVIGAHAEAIRSHIRKQDDLLVIENKEWQQGMASSVRTGLDYLLQKDPRCEAVILMVSDQPYVSTELLNKLIATHQESGKKIVSSHFDGRNGPPAFFHRQFFSELLELKGDTGAKRIVEKYAEQVAMVPFPGGAVDIDTAADYEALPEK